MALFSPKICRCRCCWSLVVDRGRGRGCGCDSDRDRDYELCGKQFLGQKLYILFALERKSPRHHLPKRNALETVLNFALQCHWRSKLKFLC